MFKFCNAWIKITCLCVGLLARSSIAFCASEPLVAAIEMRFENEQPRLSSGFMLERDSRYFFVMCNHSFHEYENWVPSEMVITPIISNQFVQAIEIRDLKTFNSVNRRIHGEKGGEQVDIAVLEIGNIPSFRQNLGTLKDYIFNFNQLADASEIQNLSVTRTPVTLRSRYGYRTAKVGVLYPKVHPAKPPQTMMGFRLDDISPPVQNGGDSGGAVFLEKDGMQKIIGMFSKGPAALVDNPNPASGATADSAMIRETIDLFYSVGITRSV